MNRYSGELQTFCPNCSDDKNEPDARFCQSCGSKMGSALVAVPAPPDPLSRGVTIGERFVIDSLLWTAPTYNLYLARSLDSLEIAFTVIERCLEPEAPKASSHNDSQSDADTLPKPFSVPSLLFIEHMGTPQEKLGIAKPVHNFIQHESSYSLFTQIHGKPLAHLDQLTERETRALGTQLCTIAEHFHRNGWVFNGFDPYGLLLVEDGSISLVGFDRARKEGKPIVESPIYPSRGYTAPELFGLDAAYDIRSDIYSIGALLHLFLTGERPPLDGYTKMYPAATVDPNFERMISRAISFAPDMRFQSISELRDAISIISLPIILQSGHCTDIGMIRELNEDSILALNLTQYYESNQTQIGLYIVSDGMGGEAAGEVASRVTVRGVAEYITEKLISSQLKSTQEEKIAAPTHTGGLRLTVADGREMAPADMLKKAIAHANREVLAYARTHPHDRGLGATVTAAMIVGEVLTLGHVGDSRCYLLSGGVLEQISEDHSVVQRMIKTGNLSLEQARIHPYRNVIYRSIGSEEEVEVDIIRRKLVSGDMILLCSDGLNGMLSNDQIRDILLVNPDPIVAAKELVVAANAAGGEDNTSIVVTRIL